MIAERSGSGHQKNDGRGLNSLILPFYVYVVWVGAVSVDVEGTHFGHWINYRFEKYYQVYVDWLG